MNRHYDNPGQRIDRHRRLAAAVALLWLVSWMMLALEPCCEAVAAALPHAHAATADHAHSAGMAPGAESSGHDAGAPGDDHCPSIETPAGSAPYLPLTGDAKPACSRRCRRRSASRHTSSGDTLPPSRRTSRPNNASSCAPNAYASRPPPHRINRSSRIAGSVSAPRTWLRRRHSGHSGGTAMTFRQPLISGLMIFNATLALAETGHHAESGDMEHWEAPASASDWRNPARTPPPSGSGARHSMPNSAPPAMGSTCVVAVCWLAHWRPRPQICVHRRSNTRTANSRGRSPRVAA